MKLNILLTNDDGIFFDGIKELYYALKDEFNIFIVAPSEEHSGTSHKITINQPLLIHKVADKDLKGISVNGTPVDCVKLALQNLYNGKIDLVVSGINKGSNNGISVHYSGTVAAIIEGAFFNIPGIAVSLYSYQDNKFKDAAVFVKDFIKKNFEFMKENSSILNINIPTEPDYSKPPIYCRQGLGNFFQLYAEHNHLGKNYFFAGGPEKELDYERDDDDRYILENEITITPLKIDLTDYEDLKKWREK
ncbi:MAG: 5'/3'-nucleotidase SurE [Candidatus Delongbacteria bacterium]|nr:5'/3'-nucleotidase SurE [Candidatus Delongbacteria bacterium]